MPRDYGRVYTAFWNSQDIRPLSDRGKLLANYLITGPHSNMLGAYLLPDAYISDDLGWSVETVRKTLDELSRNGFATRFEDGRHIVVCKFLSWNPIENPNVGKAALKQLEQLPHDEVLSHVINGLSLYEKQFPNGLETLRKRFGKPFRNQEPEPEPDQEPEPEQDGYAEPLRVRALEIPPIPFMEFPTNRPHENYFVTEREIVEYETLYPAVDVRQEIRKMRGWLLANPTKRKTNRGFPKFVNGWLSKEQDKGRSNGRGEKSSRFGIIDVSTLTLEEPKH